MSRHGSEPDVSRSHVGNGASAANDLPNRRSFLEAAGNVTMACGLAAGYGTLGYCALQYLQPGAATENLGWQFVADLKDLEGKDSFPFVTSSGAGLVFARHAEAETGFIALSSTCPHLGCQVFWEAAHTRFFCPCHNGAFDAAGAAIAGPPLAAKQSLKQYEIKSENGLVYVLAPTRNVTETSEG
jgi:Rieske Fe-S protein